MKPQHLSLTLALLVTCSGCARLTIWQKTGIIVGTGGTAGALMATSNQISAAGAVAGSVGAGILPAGVVIATGSSEATKEQADFAEQAARRYMEAVDNNRKAELAQPGRELIAVKTLRSPTTRGDAPVMIYNTRTQKLENNKAFDLRKEPKEGTRLQLETQIAEYVGEIAPPAKPASTAPKVSAQP